MPRRRHPPVILLVLLSCFLNMLVGGGTEISAQDTTYDLTLGQGQYFRCAIDSRITTVRGVYWYVNGDGTDDRAWVLNPDVQAFCVHWGFAAMATAGVGELYDNDPFSNDQLLQSALDGIAGLSGHPELSTMPWALTGISSGGYFITHEANQRPDRVIVLVCIHGGDLPAGGLVAGELGIPCLIIAGDNDGVVPVSDLYDTFLNGRAQGALCAFLVDWGADHLDQVCGDHLAAAWLDDALAQRYPLNMTGALPLPEGTTNALLANTDFLGVKKFRATTVVPVAQATYPDDPTTAAWLPDPALAAVYAAAASLVTPQDTVPFNGSPLHSDNPAQNPIPAVVTVTSGVSVGTILSVNATELTGVSAVSFTDAAGGTLTALGTVTTAVATGSGQRYQQVAALNAGIHPIIMTATTATSSATTFATIIVDDGVPSGLTLAATVALPAVISATGYQLPAAVPLSANVSPGTNTVARVDWQSDGVTVCSATAATSVSATSSAMLWTANWFNADPGGHLITAIATDSAGLASESNPLAIAVYSALPSPWLSTDFGAIGDVGDAQSTDGSTFTIQGSGAGLADGQDAGHWVYQPLSGDVDLIARVTSLPVETGGHAGLMVRGLTADDPFAALMVYTGNVVQLVSRLDQEDDLSYTAATATTLPVWIRLQRRGDLFIAATSADGVTWTTLGSVTIPIQDGAEAGLFCASDASDSENAILDNVSLTLPLAFSSAATAAGILGLPFSFTISASGAAITATGLPPGLTFHAATATITGTPTALGQTTVAVTATSALGSGSQDLVIVIYNALPAPWTIYPIDPPILGAVVASTGADGTPTFAITGAGSGINDTVDSGLFVAQTVTGDISIIADVSVPIGAGSQSMAGVMMRASTDPGAPYAYGLIQADGSYGFQVRNIQDTTSFGDGGGNATGFRWLRVQRLGNQFTCSGSGDGVNWTFIGTHPLSFPGTPATTAILVGACVASDDPTLTVTSICSDIQLAHAPVVANQTLNVGLDDIVDVQLAATNNPTTWNSDALPPNLSLDPVTGIISGVPTATGSYVLAITATNIGGDGNATLNLTIGNARTAVLYLSPAGANAVPGQNVQFTANAIDPSGNPTTAPPVTWTVNAGGVITSTGLYTATAVGVSTVTATGGGQTATAQIIVTNLPAGAGGGTRKCGLSSWFAVLLIGGCAVLLRRRVR